MLDLTNAVVQSHVEADFILATPCDDHFAAVDGLQFVSSRNPSIVRPKSFRFARVALKDPVVAGRIQDALSLLCGVPSQFDTRALMAVITDEIQQVLRRLAPMPKHVPGGEVGMFDSWLCF